MLSENQRQALNQKQSSAAESAKIIKEQGDRGIYIRYLANEITKSLIIHIRNRDGFNNIMTDYETSVLISFHLALLADLNDPTANMVAQGIRIALNNYHVLQLS